MSYIRNLETQIRNFLIFHEQNVKSQAKKEFLRALRVFKNKPIILRIVLHQNYCNKFLCLQ